MTPTRPVLRWHGGKFMLAPWIIEHFPAHRCYTEAYGGAASVLLLADGARARTEVLWLNEAAWRGSGRLL